MANIGQIVLKAMLNYMTVPDQRSRCFNRPQNNRASYHNHAVTTTLGIDALPHHNPENKDCPLSKGFACTCLPAGTRPYCGKVIELDDYEVRIEDGVAVRGPPS